MIPLPAEFARFASGRSTRAVGIILSLPVLSFHDVNHQTRQRLGEEIRRFVRHPLSGRRDRLDLANLRGIEEQRTRSFSLRNPIQRVMVIFRIQNGFLFPLRGAEGCDNQLLKQ